MIPYIRPLLIATLLASMATAAPENSERTCRLLIPFPPSKDFPHKMYLYDGTNTREVEIPTKNFSPLYPLPEGDITVRLLASPPAEGEIPDDKNSISVELAASIKQCYLLLLPGEEKDGGVPRLQSIKANEDGFKAGQMMWFNLSPFPISGEIGPRKLEIKPNGREIVDAPAKGFEQYRILLKYLPKDAETPAPLTSSMWRHKPTARSIVFVVMTPKSKLPQILSFFDTRADPEEDEGE